jgi:hypothetical protein
MDSSSSSVGALRRKFVYVVSTDIKKSSLLWSHQGGVWMKNHIVLHHAIIQGWAIDHGFSLLPNSPEGDAFVMYRVVKRNTPEFRRTILSYTQNLQRRFGMFYEKTTSGAYGALLLPHHMKGTLTKKDFGGKAPGIHLRVGVASGEVTDTNWTPYNFKISSYESSCGDLATSYRGEVVVQSEEMEKKSDVGGYAYRDLDTLKKNIRTVPAKTVSESPFSSLEREFHGRTDLIYRELQSTMTEETKPAVVAFIHGECVIKPEANKPIRHESIKVKRDQTQMVVFYPDRDQDKAAGETAIRRALAVLKPGPDCHIGLSFGAVSITSIRFAYGLSRFGSTRKCVTKDVFGDVVNLAARAAGAGVEHELFKPFTTGDYRHYLLNKKCHFVILVPAQKIKNPETDVRGLTKTQLMRVIKNGKRRKNHDELHGQTCHVGLHLLDRHDINAGKKGEQLFQWWW